METQDKTTNVHSIMGTPRDATEALISGWSLRGTVVVYGAVETKKAADTLLAAMIERGGFTEEEPISVSISSRSDADIRQDLAKLAQEASPDGNS